VSTGHDLVQRQMFRQAACRSVLFPCRHRDLFRGRRRAAGRRMNCVVAVRHNDLRNRGEMVRVVTIGAGVTRVFTLAKNEGDDMRRWKFVLLPVALLGLASAGSAQSRSAPSITEAMRKTPTRPVARPGVTARGVNLPQEQRCRDRDDDRWDNRGRDDRNDRNRRDHDRYDRNDRRDDRNERYDGCDRECERDDRDSRYDRGRSSANSGTGRLEVRPGSRGSIANGRVNPRGNDNRNDGCGYYDDRNDHRDGRNDPRRDGGHDRWPSDRRW
jgi:hypothetical protein